MPAIYLTQPGSQLSAKRQYFVIGTRTPISRPIAAKMVSQIALFGNCHLTCEAETLARSHDIPVLLFDDRAQFAGRSYLPRSCQHWQQIDLSENRDRYRELAESFLRAKIHNSSIVLRKLVGLGATPAITATQRILKVLEDEVLAAPSLEVLRGYSATATAYYDRALEEWLARTLLFQYAKALHLPAAPFPYSPFQLLRVGEVLLHQTLDNFAREVGVDPALGYLHTSDECEFPLICDWVAEFRPVLVDDLVVEFSIAPVPQVEARECRSQMLLEAFLDRWEQRLRTIALTPMVRGDLTYRQCLQHQVRQYVQVLLGDLEYYRPFLVRPSDLPARHWVFNPSEASVAVGG